MDYDSVATKFKELVSEAEKIVVLQADNPDGDSLSSALALEQIFGEAGKEVYLYCGIDMPDYLKHQEGWDRVVKDFPSNYDLAVLVDCGFTSLLGNLASTAGMGALKSDKLIILDHHDSPHDLEAALDINDISAVATGQLIYELCQRAELPIDKLAASFIASSILADSLGFTSEAMTGRPRPFEIMAELTKLGLNLAELQEKRLERLKVTPDILHYRGELLQRVEFHADGRLALITIPYDEIKEHSQEFNPTVVLDETRMVHGVAVSVGLKQYVSGGRLVRITGRIRCNRGVRIADKLARIFGDENGGGHPYAAGFKIESDNMNYDEIKSKVITEATRLLDNS